MKFLKKRAKKEQVDPYYLIKTKDVAQVNNMGVLSADKIKSQGMKFREGPYGPQIDSGPISIPNRYSVHEYQKIANQFNPLRSVSSTVSNQMIDIAENDSIDEKSIPFTHVESQKSKFPSIRYHSRDALNQVLVSREDLRNSNN